MSQSLCCGKGCRKSCKGFPALAACYFGPVPGQSYCASALGRLYVERQREYGRPATGPLGEKLSFSPTFFAPQAESDRCQANTTGPKGKALLFRRAFFAIGQDCIPAPTGRAGALRPAPHAAWESMGAAARRLHFGRNGGILSVAKRE